ncbi:RNA polymerase sigma factor [Butyrivibrio sp. AD3002]|uniref:RNA polymerase sigma factor n=1 Tax=Butyrivibrio sp. AD3002 TaxID=1280670 RepID=UPI0003B6E577|nr:sigma factor [Butyrivibrio sp. AD3002]
MEEMEARRIVDNYADMILRISSGYVKSRSEAQDICQTVFLKYITAGKEFASHQDEKAWIIRITINECKNVLKSAFFRRTVGLEELGDIKDEAIHRCCHSLR